MNHFEQLQQTVNQKADKLSVAELTVIKDMVDKEIAKRKESKSIQFSW